MKKHIPPFILGFLALSFQIFLLREFSAHFYGNEITFGILLASWLLWGGLGSITAAKLKFNIQNLPKFYYGIIILFPLCLLCLRFSRFFLKILPGEVTGVFPLLVISLILAFFISFPLGVLFVFNTSFLRGNVTQVYLMESLGASTAGLVVYFLLIPLFSNWVATGFICISMSVVLFLFFRESRSLLLFFIAVVFSAGFCFFDFPSQKIYWEPFPLVQSKDTLYGKLQVIKTEEQISLYNNSLLIYSYPDLATAEESIHFALLQNPHAANVLLIGGGAGGGLEQVLKYPQVKVDHVELNPEIIRLSLKYLPQKEQRIYQDKRVHIYYQDGVKFLNEVKKLYDIIILNLPAPATAQINRFYTKEFFFNAKKKLKRGGIFSFRISSAENYISYDLQNLLASLFYTLREAFPIVKIVPGDTNIFLASAHPFSLNYQEIEKKITSLNLHNVYVSPQLLFSRLNPQRVELLKEKISSGNRVLNLDLSPISYFYNSVLWSTQFKGLESKFFQFLSKASRFWLLDFPFFLFIVWLFILVLKRKKTSFFLVPLTVMGFTTITVEIILIIGFQAFYGYLYQRIALLFTAFMIGLFFGAYFGKKRKKTYLQVLLFQFGFILLLFLILTALESHLPELLFFILLLSLGFLGGGLFIFSNSLFLKEKKNYGLAYGLDLLGSFLGALTVSAFLIPLVGLLLLVKYIFLLNSFCFLFLLVGIKKK